MIDLISGFFDGVRYYDFPSYEVAIFSLLLAFILSSLIALVYKWTYQGKDIPNHFVQGMILSANVSAMIMMAVGSNLAIGFGIIGAVAIIRFRMNIQDTRNIIFIFAALSVGISTGVYGYSIAVSGSVIFCLIALLLRFSSFGIPQHSIEVIVYTVEEMPDISPVLRDATSSFALKQMKKLSEKGFRLDYTLLLKDGITEHMLFEALSQHEDLSEIRISSINSTAQL